MPFSLTNPKVPSFNSLLMQDIADDEIAEEQQPVTVFVFPGLFKVTAGHRQCLTIVL
jgi:hypothetical protein